MYNVNMLAFVSHSDGFGINTDIFETNILNLSVVIGVLVYYGRAAFTERFILASFNSFHCSVDFLHLSK